LGDQGTGSFAKAYCRAQRRLLTTMCHKYIIGNKSNEGQDASL